MPVANKPHRDALLESYSIGLKLRTLRNGKGLTLSRLGGESGLSSALLSKLESDLMVPTLATLAKICRVYGIGLGYFFAEVQHHSSAITRKAQMLEGRREQGTVKSTPLHVPHAESKQVSQHRTFAYNHRDSQRAGQTNRTHGLRLGWEPTDQQCGCGGASLTGRLHCA
jgi:transcriptional regulator with XRE-family HTH domain